MTEFLFYLMKHWKCWVQILLKDKLYLNYCKMDKISDKYHSLVEKYTDIEEKDLEDDGKFIICIVFFWLNCCCFAFFFS